MEIILATVNKDGCKKVNEVDEISPEDLKAAADFYDRLPKSPPTERECGWCEAPFQPKDKYQFECSDACNAYENGEN